MFRRLATAGVVVGGLIAAGAFLANVGMSATAPLATASGSVASALLANGTGPTTPGTSGGFGSAWGGRHGGFGRHGSFGFGYRGGGLTVTGVSGTTITATGRGGQTVTIQVNATTAYTEAGASATLSDIHASSIIAVQGSYANTSGTTINATGVTILLPREAGVVTNVTGNTVTLTGFDGASHTVDVTGQTRYRKAGASAALSDVTTGTAIVAEGTLDSNGTLSAVRVTIQEPRVAGRITAVNGSTYTITGRFGVTYSVTASGSTTYVHPDGTSATASAVTTGTFIAAEGTLSADGKTLAAQRIVVVPAGTAFGGGHHHRFGDGRQGFGNGSTNSGAPGATAPAATGTQNV